MRKIVFTGRGYSTPIGSFVVGDTARVSDTLAEHLVSEAKVARYEVEQPRADEHRIEQQVIQPPIKRGRGRPRKARS